MLDAATNYIVSGLERSGTSVMMQMLHKGGVPVGFDDSRPPDEHNPKGYYELAGGKIINRLMDGTFDIDAYKGHVIKVTAYGLKFLPSSTYKIIYMMRDINEVLKSMQKMGAEVDWEKDEKLYRKLNNFCFDLMRGRDDMVYITINYRDVIESPRDQLKVISDFLGIRFDFEEAIQAVDAKLYRNRSR